MRRPLLRIELVGENRLTLSLDLETSSETSGADGVERSLNVDNLRWRFCSGRIPYSGSSRLRRERPGLDILS